MTRKAPQAALLTTKQELVLGALLDGGTRKAAAEAAGVNVRTIRDWFEPGHRFRAEYDRRIAEMHTDVRSRYRSVIDSGTTYLVEMMGELRTDFDDADTDQRVRIANAVKSIVGDAADRAGHPKSDKPWDHVPEDQHAGDAPDLSTQAGREKMAEMLATLPPEVLAEAAKRQRSE